MKTMKSIWNQLFLEERSSISLSLFRIAVALTTIFHVTPSLVHLKDNYFSTAFKRYNSNFFPIETLELVQKSPEWVILLFVWLFFIFSFFFLIGFLSQLSCIVMTFCCYYFYALNAFHVGTLSWDILLVTLFLMCVVPYHGDYFSVDCLFKKIEEPYKRKRPYFLQRLLQLQIGFTFFYTACYKISAEGNWLKDNPIYYLMNTPGPGVTKYFLLRDFLVDKPQMCYLIGLLIVLIELLMIFLLFFSRTRLSAIYLGIVFHIALILTLDVPAIFFFLFPPQLLLFINPDKIVTWIEQKRAHFASTKQGQLIYDGNCQFCLNSVRKLKVMDLYQTLEFVNYHDFDDLKELHPDLSKDQAHSQLHLIEPNNQLYGGYQVFRRLCLVMPMLYPLIFICYFPGMGIIGPIIYRFVAKNRYLFHFKKNCRNNACFR